MINSSLLIRPHSSFSVLWIKLSHQLFLQDIIRNTSTVIRLLYCRTIWDSKGWVEWKETDSKPDHQWENHSSCHRMVEAQTYVTEERLPAWLPLTFDIFYIPPVHLARNHGANMREESEEVRSHTTDQTLELMRSRCEACHSE